MSASNANGNANDEIHPAPAHPAVNTVETKGAAAGSAGSDQEKPLQNVNNVPDDIEVGPTSFEKPTYATNKYAVDAFSAQRDENGEDYLDFRTMGWFQAGLVSTAENIAIGLLSFPSVFLRLSVVGGMIGTVGLGTLAYITAWIMVDFKLKYMGVMNIGDAGELMFGKLGRRWFGWGLVLKAMGLAGSHVLGGEEALRSLSSNSICGVWWGLIIAVFSVMISYSREWGKLTLWAFVSLTCILTASFITIVGTGVQDSSVLIKNNEPIVWRAFPENPNLMDVIGALTNIVFAYGGNMAVFTFCSEMRKPNDFKKSFLLNQGLGTTMYILVGCLVYVFGGQYVTSPAFTMLSRTLTIVSYSFALVTIIISGVIAANIGAKYLYVHTLRDSPLLTSNGWKAHFIWIGVVSTIWTVAFLVSQLVPFFNQLLTIVSSLFSVWLTYGSAGIIWFWDESPWMRNFARDENERKMTRAKWFKAGIAVLSIVLSLAITPLGLYSAIQGIINGYSKGSYKHPFAC